MSLTMPDEEMEAAKDLFAQIIKEHLEDKRCMTILRIVKLDDRLRIHEEEDCICSI